MYNGFVPLTRRDLFELGSMLLLLSFSSSPSLRPCLDCEADATQDAIHQQCNINLSTESFLCSAKGSGGNDERCSSLFL